MTIIAHAQTPADLQSISCPHVAAGLLLLRAAHAGARAACRPAWEFAVEIEELHALGLTNADLRSLLCAGLLLHGVERLRSGSGPRTFRQIANLALPPRSCFVLAEKGLQVSGRLGDVPPAPAPLACRAPRGPGRACGCRPSWDGTLRRLCWHGHLVKHYRLKATNQEAVLAALEEEGWPPHIDDPLTQVEGLDSKARLHDTIKNLNRHQVNSLLCFHGDGTGQGVLWSPVVGADPDDVN
jgi:hypothetical protein